MSPREMAEEIKVLQEKIGALNGDDYWKALYRIKELAGTLAKHTLDDNRLETATKALHKINAGRHGDLCMTEMALIAWNALQNIAANKRG